jgi:hypothetical protein
MITDAAGEPTVTRPQRFSVRMCEGYELLTDRLGRVSAWLALKIL